MAGGLRIAALTTSFPRHGEDHAGRFVHDLHAGLGELGHRVTTLCPAARDASASEEGPAGPIHRLSYGEPGEEDLFYGDGLEANWPRTRRRWRKLRRFLRAATTALRELEPSTDVYLAHWLWPCALPAVRTARPSRAPVLGVAHGGDVGLLARPILGRLLARPLHGRLTGVLCTSRRGAAIVSRRIAPDRIVVAPLGVDTMRFRPREGGATPWPAPYLLGVGRLLPIKGFDVLVRAAARLDMPLVLAGDGPQRRALLALAQRLGTDLRLTGHLGPDAVAAAMAGSAAVVIPSRTLGTREEGCPVVALEALAVGVPVLASATGGLVDLLPPECLFPSEDDEALATRLRTVMAAPRSPTVTDARCDRRHTARVLLDLLAATPM